MKKWHKAVLFGIIVASAIALKPNGHVAPSNAYPDPTLTPGLVATTDFKELTLVQSCGTYSQCHRKTTSSMKSIVCKEYPANCTGTQEIDHFCPLALGCADDVKNLWAEPEHLFQGGMDWGFHTKDKLETFMVNEMKAGRISPNDAQQCILKDWAACYIKYFTGAFGIKQFGGVIIDPDNL